MRTWGVGLTVAIALALALAIDASAASRERETLDRAIRAIREAQAEVRFPGNEPRVDELLGRARDRLWRHDEDPDLRRAIRHVERAIDALRDSWRSPSERAWRVRDEGDEAIALIRGSRLYAADTPRPAPQPERVRIGSFTKRTFEGERFTMPISGATAARSFARIVVVVTPGERGFTPILNTVLVRVQGRWVEHALRYRTAPGENALAIEVPRGATEVLFSLDHGKGARVEAFLD